MPNIDFQQVHTPTKNLPYPTQPLFRGVCIFRNPIYRRTATMIRALALAPLIALSSSYPPLSPWLARDPDAIEAILNTN